MVQYLINGLAAGLGYAVLAAAVTLIYGLARIVHVALADFAMLSAMVMVVVYQDQGNWLISAGAGLGVGLIVSTLTERAIFRFTFGLPVTGFLASLGLSLLIRGFVVETWGSEARSVEPALTGSVEILNTVVRWQVLLNALVGVTVLAATFLLIYRTRFGFALRAIADDRRSAALMGIPVNRVISAVFVLAAFSTVTGSWMMANSGAVDFLSGNGFLLMAFVAALLGGLGNLFGAVSAGVLIGVAEHLAIGYGQPGWSSIYVFLLIIAVLLVRPTGLLTGTAGAELRA